MRIRCFTIFRIDKYSIHFYIISLLNSLYCYIHYMVCPISFSDFSDVIPAFTGARAIANL